MHCSTGHSKLRSPLFSVALQNRLPAGLGHSNYTYGDLLFIQVCSVNFFKPGPDPPPLPREPRLKTPVPQEDLKEFKQAFAQETGALTADLLQELDSTLELAYTVKETLDQSETLKMALTSVDIGANTVVSYSSLLQDILQQVLPIAQKICKFAKGGPASGFRLRTRCTNRKLEGLSKLQKSLHKVAETPKTQARKYAMTYATLYKQS